MKEQGKIVQVDGPVVDVQFDANRVPAIYNALEIEMPSKGRLVLEVQQHLGEGSFELLLCLRQGVVRGQLVIDTGTPY